eukprot:m.256664 g.256664  ORF g.256664 m.256664 type:complete len:306 (+) comp34569_c0_seq1:25-942(+)
MSMSMSVCSPRLCCTPLSTVTPTPWLLAFFDGRRLGCFEELYCLRLVLLSGDVTLCTVLILLCDSCEDLKNCSLCLCDIGGFPVDPRKTRVSRDLDGCARVLLQRLDRGSLAADDGPDGGRGKRQFFELLTRSTHGLHWTTRLELFNEFLRLGNGGLRSHDGELCAFLVHLAVSTTLILHGTNVGTAFTEDDSHFFLVGDGDDFFVTIVCQHFGNSLQSEKNVFLVTLDGEIMCFFINVKLGTCFRFDLTDGGTTTSHDDVHRSFTRRQLLKLHHCRGLVNLLRWVEREFNEFLCLLDLFERTLG